jgi:hypothetical protein
VIDNLVRDDPVVVARMTDYLPTDELRFLMERSIEPVAAQLGLLEPMS